MRLLVKHGKTQVLPYFELDIMSSSILFLYVKYIYVYMCVENTHSCVYIHLHDNTCIGSRIFII